MCTRCTAPETGTFGGLLLLIASVVAVLFVLVGVVSALGHLGAAFVRGWRGDAEEHPASRN